MKLEDYYTCDLQNGSTEVQYFYIFRGCKMSDKKDGGLFGWREWDIKLPVHPQFIAETKPSKVGTQVKFIETYLQNKVLEPLYFFKDKTAPTPREL